MRYLFFMVMYRDQFGEFVCGYWGLKAKAPYLPLYLSLERGSEDGADYVPGSRVPTELLS